MPIYEYRCNDCEAISEYLLGIGPQSKSISCKHCGSPKLEKIISISHSLKGEKRPSGHTCCGREERCSTPPCSTESGCKRD